MQVKKPSRAAVMGGYALVAVAAIGTGSQMLLRANYSDEINAIITASDALIAAIGAATLLIASALNKVEERISRLEARLKTD